MSINTVEVPEDILPRQEDELNHLDYQQYDAAVAVHIWGDGEDQTWNFLREGFSRDWD
jgi:hypothetical protein